jgi:hypothetical protein
VNNEIYPKVLEKIIILLKRQKYIIFSTTEKNSKIGSIVQFATPKLIGKGNYAKNRQRIEIMVRKDGIKLNTIDHKNRVNTKYSRNLMSGAELKSFCREIDEYSQDFALDNVAEQIFGQFELNYQAEKIDELISSINPEI